MIRRGEAARRIYFVGRRQGLRLWTNRPHDFERRREGEVAGLRSQGALAQTLLPRRAHVLFARSIPERTTDGDLAALRRFVDRYDDGTRLVLNPPRSFLEADSKDRAFTLWRRAGLACPRHRVLRTEPDDPEDLGCLDEVAAILAREPRLVLRTNNETESRGLFVVEADTPTDDLAAVLRELKERTARLRRRGRGDTRILAVQYVEARDPDGFATLARVFVLFDRVIGYWAVVSDAPEFRVSQMRPEAFERFLEANRSLTRILDEPGREADLVRAVTSLGHNIGAVDCLIRDGVPVLLEVNPLWGGVPNRYAFGTPEFERLLERTEETWSKELPNVVESLDAVRSFRELYAYVAEYYDRCAENGTLRTRDGTSAAR